MQPTKMHLNRRHFSRVRGYARRSSQALEKVLPVFPSRPLREQASSNNHSSNFLQLPKELPIKWVPEPDADDSVILELTSILNHSMTAASLSPLKKKKTVCLPKFQTIKPYSKNPLFLQQPRLTHLGRRLPQLAK